MVLYMLDGVPTHAARQLTDGTWSSKLGRFHDISHSIDGLSGNEYGRPVLYLRRKKSTAFGDNSNAGGRLTITAPLP